MCGAERACIDHDTTEGMELIPAEVIVRLDRRELLACEGWPRGSQRASLRPRIAGSWTSVVATES
ncbi:MAG: hypothetical protein M3O36_19425 [Myxococcota bacterium]|nr:hypothetical protein [Myxococcota bacterium]